MQPHTQPTVMNCVLKSVAHVQHYIFPIQIPVHHIINTIIYCVVYNAI